jgi:hypothetical protein
MMTFNKITKIIVGINKDTKVHDSQDSSVSIVTALQAGQSGLESWQGKDISLFTMSSRQALGPSQPSYSIGTGSPSRSKEAEVCC